MPEPLRVRDGARQVRAATATDAAVLVSDDYGAGRSVVISRDGTDEPLRTAGPAPAGDPQAKLVVRIADLRDVLDGGGNFAGWAHEATSAITRSRSIPNAAACCSARPCADHASSPFLATFHYGRARDIGGGEYERTPAERGRRRRAATRVAIARRCSRSSIAGHARRTAAHRRQPDLREDAGLQGRRRCHATRNFPSVVVGAARNGARPLIAASGAMPLEIGARGTLVLDGLVIRRRRAAPARGRGQRAARP